MGDVVQLRDDLTDAQALRAMKWALEEVRRPASGQKTSLCQDIAELHHQIQMVAVLSGAKVPRWRSPIPKKLGDEVFQRLYNHADALLKRAMDEYPGTQMPPKPSPRRNPRRSQTTKNFGDYALDNTSAQKR